MVAAFSDKSPGGTSLNLSGSHLNLNLNLKSRITQTAVPPLARLRAAPMPALAAAGKKKHHESLSDFNMWLLVGYEFMV
jgi:hypothetical protein